MAGKIVYQLDQDGFLIGEAIADESPLEPGIFLIPAGCIEAEPPAETQGKRRAFRAGEWTYVDLPAPEEVIQQTFEEFAKAFMLSVRGQREQILNRLAGIGLVALVAGDIATAQSIVMARESLLNITKDPDVLAAVDEKGLRTAVLAAYRRIVAVTPESVRSAFNEVDL